MTPGIFTYALQSCLVPVILFLHVEKSGFLSLNVKLSSFHFTC